MREHYLRHAYISELMSMGISPKAVSEIAGHYSRLDRDAIAAATIGAFVF